LHTDRAPGFAGKLRGIFGVLAAPHVVAAIVVPVALDSRVAERGAGIIDGAEAAAIAPRAIELVVIGPRQLKVISSLRLATMSGPVEFESRDDGAFRIRRLRRDAGGDCNEEE